MATRRTTSTTTAAAPAGSRARKPGARELAAQATRDSLLRAATKVFARHGFSGGSVERISRAARSYDRMIYYYFGNKEGLYLAVLEEAYRRFNEAESRIALDENDPVEGLRAVVRFVLGYYRANPDFVTLLNTENLHRGRHIRKTARAGEHASPAIAILERLLAAGVEQGQFRPDLAARDLYLMIAGLGYFYQSNRYTLSSFLGENLEAPQAVAHWEAFVIDVVLRATRTSPPQDAAPARTRPRHVQETLDG